MTDRQELNSKNSKRFLKLLSKYKKSGLPIEQAGGKSKLFASARTYTFENEILAALSKQRHVNIVGGRAFITALGIAALKYLLEPQMAGSATGLELQTVVVEHDGTRQNAVQNINESPLGKLYHRKTKDGISYISRAEFEAGERLRQDFERGQLQPKISASLQGAMGSTKHGGRNNSADISDFAVDARRRLGNALDKLGPELSGVALDICCFLKGYELVERERKWPPRSAKLMLKTGLSVLARHYGLVGMGNSNSTKMRKWTAADYRPKIA